MRDYTEKGDEVDNNKRRINNMWEKPKRKRKMVIQKMVTVNSRKYHVQFDESHHVDNCSIVKDQTPEERSKILWRKTLFY